MTRDLAKLGRRLAAERTKQGLSALALSKAAGLSMNYVRNVERGLRRPRTEPLMAICRALEFNERTTAEFRQLAGIDPDPASDPEGRKARREYWPILAYILANHVLLPRLELLNLLESSGVRQRAVADLFRLAAAAPSAAALADQVVNETSPPAPVHRLIDRYFAFVWANVLRVCCEKLKRPGAEEANPIYNLTLHLRTWDPDEIELSYDAFLECEFDRTFAVCFFPALYWHACWCWPFAKVLLPFGFHGPSQQQQLYDAVRAGMPLAELDETLLGHGPLGRAIASSSPSRGHHDWAAAAPNQSRHVSFSMYATELDETFRISGSLPPADAVFDHLDRFEFLSRFPLIKFDTETFAVLARKLGLRSRQTWVDYVLRHCDPPPPPDAAIRGPTAFTDVLSLEWWRQARSESPTIAQLAEAYRLAVERLVRARAWDPLTQAGKLLDLQPAWQRFVDAFRQAGSGLKD